MLEPLQGILTALLLPPLSLVLLCLLAGLLAWRGARWAGAVAAIAALAQLLLATPFVAGHLMVSLQDDIAPAAGPAPAAIVILSGDGQRTADGTEVGALTLERLRAGAVLHRRTGLPILLTGGSLAPEQVPIAEVMARSLREDFGITARWIEPRARDTRENAVFSIALLREDGVGAAWIVTHAWHMPRSQEAFARSGFSTRAAPVRLDRAPEGIVTDFAPRPDHLAHSWYALREWVGRLVYRLRDGG